jgi:hypothetical protein
MKLRFYAAGKERKKLAAAIGEVIVQPVSYNGAPGFEYQIGDFILSRDSVLVYNEADAEAVNAMLPVLIERGFNAIIEGSEAEHDNAPDSPAQEDEVPPLEDSNDGAIAQPDGLTIEMPIDGFTDVSLANLEKVIASKAALIKKAVGTDTLAITQTGSVIQFPWFPAGLSSDEVKAHTQFVSALCAAAKEQGRVTAKEKLVENEKFVFRVFLVRLGFVGAEFKTARKILLKNLSGNSAWKNGRPVEAEVSNEISE